MKRAKWKNLFIKPEFFKKKYVDGTKISRNSSILPKFLGLTFYVHSGKLFKKVLVSKEMIGHKFGEFSQTRMTFAFKKKNKRK
jgi:small subunit ribosomal protein S19